MSLRIPLIAALLVTFASACKAPIPEGRAVGEPLIRNEVVALSIIEQNPHDYFERTLLVEAAVSGVCQNSGCWMKVEDGGATAMVRWETGCGGKYSFPSDAVGRRVLIQGSFYPNRISEEDAEHLESESGGIAIEREGYELNASAVLILEDSSQG